MTREEAMMYCEDLDAEVYEYLTEVLGLDEMQIGKMIEDQEITYNESEHRPYYKGKPIPPDGKPKFRIPC